MALYLSGPMTNLPGYNRPAFRAAATRLRHVGYTVVDPSEIEHIPDPAVAWDAKALQLALLLMLDPAHEVDALALLPGHHNSRGARAEVDLARRLGWAVQTVEDWLDAALIEAIEAAP